MNRKIFTHIKDNKFIIIKGGSDGILGNVYYSDQKELFIVETKTNHKSITIELGSKFWDDVKADLHLFHLDSESDFWKTDKVEVIEHPSFKTVRLNFSLSIGTFKGQTFTSKRQYYDARKSYHDFRKQEKSEDKDNSPDSDDDSIIEKINFENIRDYRRAYEQYEVRYKGVPIITFRTIVKKNADQVKKRRHYDPETDVMTPEKAIEMIWSQK